MEEMRRKQLEDYEDGERGGRTPTTLMPYFQLNSVREIFAFFRSRGKMLIRGEPGWLPMIAGGPMDDASGNLHS